MRCTEGAALVALAIVALWVFVGLPMMYLPNQGEHEAIKPGEWLVGLATVALFLVTLGLWLATRDLVRGAEDTARRQLRPYLMISEAHVNLQLGDHARAVVRLSNSGSTPAIDVEVGVVLGRDRYPLNRDRVPVFALANRGPIGPNTTIEMPVWNGLEILDAQKLQDLREGRFAIFVIGLIRYRDTFDQQHETHFTLFTGGPFKPVVDDSLTAYEIGNSVT